MPLNTHCPKCETRYLVNSETLMGASGLAHCYRCGTLFDVFTEKAAGEGADDILLIQSAINLDHRSEMAAAAEARPAEPSFDVPVDLEPLQPSADASLDVADSLYEKRPPARLVYLLVTIVLVTGLGLQLAWQYRADLLARYPGLEAVCTYLPCRPSKVRAPEEFRVLQRDIRPTANEPKSLTLHARIRNEADLPQPLPDIQLSLLDNNGAVLIRRRLAPRDYLFPAPPKDKVIAPGEVITISVDFKDPGYLATGFVIDFL